MSRVFANGLLSLCLICLAAPAMAAGGVDAGKAKSAVCSACHGELGQSPSAEYPDLAGQHQDYLVKALKDYRSGARKNAIMAGFSSSLTDQDIAALVAYYAAQEDLFTQHDD